MTPEELVSIIGDRYLEPISDLAEKLFSFTQSQNDVQVSPMENGYSVSLCILAIAWFESWTMRVRYLNGTSNHATIRHSVDFLKAIYPDLPDYDGLMEIFVLRDTLVHNHLWLIDFSWDANLGMKLHKAQKDAFSGDKKYEQYVNIPARRTKKLQLNIVPIKVGRGDVKTVLTMAWDSLSFIKMKDPEHIGVANQYIHFQKRFMSMPEFITCISSIKPTQT
jgi:hypothetical protein